MSTKSLEIVKGLRPEEEKTQTGEKHPVSLTPRLWIQWNEREREVERCRGKSRGYRRVGANSWAASPLKKRKKKTGSSLAARRWKRGMSGDERRSVRYEVSDERWVADGR